MTKSAELRELLRQVGEALQQESLQKLLGPRRSLFEPFLRPLGDRSDPDMSLLVASAPHANPEFLRRHPYARHLLQPVPLQSSIDTLEALVALLQDGPGVNVFVDFKALNESGIAMPERPRAPSPKRAPAKRARVKGDNFMMADDEVNPFGGPEAAKPAAKAAAKPASKDAEKAAPSEHRGDRWPVIGKGRMSLRSFAKFFLQQQGLALVEEPHMLRITSQDHADALLKTEVYPVADLRVANRVPDPEQLSDPYLDCELIARQRIKAKLRQPMTIEFKEKPLHDVVKHLATILDDTVLLDDRALSDAGIAPDTAMTASWRHVPAKDSLREILRQVGLDYVVVHEALVITTADAAQSQLTVRLHSGIGVVGEAPCAAAG